MKGILQVSAGDSALLKNQHNDLFFKILNRLELDRQKQHSQKGFTSVQRSEHYDDQSDDEVVHALHDKELKLMKPHDEY